MGQTEIKELVTVVNSDEAINMLMLGKDLYGCYLTKEGKEAYDSNKHICKDPSEVYCIDDIIEDTFHESNIATWHMPEEFKIINIEQHVLALCHNDAETNRVNMELKMFNDRELYSMLRFLIYLVDYFRSNKYVWGVGRGSAVSSYVLYLLGVHKVDSIKYNLSIEEFLK